MIPNALIAFLQDLEPWEANKLAEFLDALSQTLRLHAKSEVAAKSGRDAALSRIYHAKDLALELHLGGVPFLIAARRGASNFVVPLETVEFHLHAAIKERDAAAMVLRNKRILEYTRNGKTLRWIAGQFDLSKSGVHKIIQASRH